MTSTDDSQLRAEVLALVRELHAILILASEIDKEWVQILNQLRLRIAMNEGSELVAQKEMGGTQGCRSAGSLRCKGKP
jgi:hypothetical protein